MKNMQREIKFRAWNVATKTMIDLKKITPLALNMDSDGLFLPFSDGLPLMQFTGLKDKNGKDIYEGDVIRRSTGYVFEMRATTYSISGNTVLDKRKGCIVIGYQHDMLDEVIGNIHENPELLTNPMANK